MIESCKQFFYMGGYGFYVFSAYASVIFLLSLLWYLPWRRFRKYSRMHEAINKESVAE